MVGREDKTVHRKQPKLINESPAPVLRRLRYCNSSRRRPSASAQNIEFVSPFSELFQERIFLAEISMGAFFTLEYRDDLSDCAIDFLQRSMHQIWVPDIVIRASARRSDWGGWKKWKLYWRSETSSDWVTTIPDGSDFGNTWKVHSPRVNINSRHVALHVPAQDFLT